MIRSRLKYYCRQVLKGNFTKKWNLDHLLHSWRWFERTTSCLYPTFVDRERGRQVWANFEVINKVMWRDTPPWHHWGQMELFCRILPTLFSTALSRKRTSPKNSYNVLSLQVSMSDSEEENTSSASSDNDLEKIFAYTTRNQSQHSSGCRRSSYFARNWRLLAAQRMVRKHELVQVWSAFATA